MNKAIFKTKVVTRSFIADIFASVKNFIGMDITEYEDMINKAQQNIMQELKDEKIELDWFRFEISQLTNGAMVIMLYGEEK